MAPKFEIKGKLKPSKQQHLADTIPRSFATSTFDTQERNYLPEPLIKGRHKKPTIEGLITEDTIDKEFRRTDTYFEYSSEQQRVLVSWILEEASKVFAITVQCHLEPQYLLWSMMNFCNNEFTDKCLPIEEPKAAIQNNSQRPVTAAFDPDLWSELRHDEFFQQQWSCLAPVFILGKYEYDLRAQCILPFKKASMGPRGGSFSSVYKVIVHRDHQKRHPSREVSLPYLHYPRVGLRKALGCHQADNDPKEHKSAGDRESLGN